MASLGLTAVLGVHQKQRLMRKDIHQPRDTATRELDRPQGGIREQCRPGIAGDGEPMRHVVEDFVARQRLEPVLKGDALTQLAHRLGGQLAVELGLPEQHHLHELALFGFEDRKSTRLNSSHLVISYAVFCLKKKKKKTRDALRQEDRYADNHATS